MKVHGHIRYMARTAPFCAVACAVLGTLFLGLGGLRLYSLSLENRLNQLSHQIEIAQEEMACLEAQVALLVAPPKIFDTAWETLGMRPPREIAVVHVPKTPVHKALTLEGAAASVAEEDWKGIFVSAANASE